MEHALPVPVLYDDILTLYALSGTGATPTHIVNYGGAWGEQFIWATEDVPNDPKYEFQVIFDISRTHRLISGVDSDALQDMIY